MQIGQALAAIEQYDIEIHAIQAQIDAATLAGAPPSVIFQLTLQLNLVKGARATAQAGLAFLQWQISVVNQQIAQAGC